MTNIMKMKMMFVALPLLLSTALSYADNLQKAVINSDTTAALLSSALVESEGYKGGEFAPTPLKKGTKVRVEQTGERFAYRGVELVQVIPEGQSTPVWT
jgi:hypothetical protein